MQEKKAWNEVMGHREWLRCLSMEEGAWLSALNHHSSSHKTWEGGREGMGAWWCFCPVWDISQLGNMILNTDVRRKSSTVKCLHQEWTENTQILHSLTCWEISSFHFLAKRARWKEWYHSSLLQMWSSLQQMCCCKAANWETVQNKQINKSSTAH